MGVLQRVGDILSANIHDLVDRFEDPEKMLRQAIREMEALVQETMDGAAKSIATEKLLLKDLASEEHLAKQWEDKAERAVQAGDDPAARKALGRRMEHERLAKSLPKEPLGAEKATNAPHAQTHHMQATITTATRQT